MSNALTRKDAGRPSIHLSITFYPDNGDISLNGPLDDPALFFELLKLASVAYVKGIRRPASEAPRIVTPFPNA